MFPRADQKELNPAAAVQVSELKSHTDSKVKPHGWERKSTVEEDDTPKKCAGM